MYKADRKKKQQKTKRTFLTVYMNVIYQYNRYNTSDRF